MHSFDEVELHLAHDLETVKHANSGLETLPIALLMCQLSERAYESEKIQTKLIDQYETFVTCGPAGLPKQEYRAKLIGSQLAAPDDKQKRQFAMWAVENVGFVAAFRGTADYTDVCTDLDFSAEPLTSSSGSEVQLHGGMVRGVSQTVQEVLDLYQKHKSEWKDLPLFWTGHSLGGGYAICALLYALAKHPREAVSACGEGGVFTFGAPLVLSQKSGACSQQVLADLLPIEHKMAAARMCMHHYVNNMDIVPRLLGATRLNKLIESMLRVLPAGSTGQLASSLSSVISRAGDFVPFGQYHLVLGASLRSVDAAVDQAALLFSWKQAVDFLSKIIVTGPTTQYALYIQWLQDHYVANYSLSLTAVAMAITIRLPPGQDPSQAKTVLVRSNDGPGGLGLGVMCNLNGVKTVMRNVFAERKDWKKALAIGTAGAVGLVVGQNEDHLQGLMQAGANHLPGLLSKHLPGQLAKLATSSGTAPAAASQIASGAASAAGAAVAVAGSVVVPLLATQLAVGLLNLAVTAYVVHRVHKLDKKIDAFRAETNVKLDLVTSGISNIQTALQDQKLMLTASVNMIDGKLDNLIAGQKLIYEEVVSLRGDVQVGFKGVHDQLLAMKNTEFRQKFAMLEEMYCEVLRRIGQPEYKEINVHHASLLKERGHKMEWLGMELQHDLLSRLDGYSDVSSPSCLAQRQPMVLAYCFAALARDVGNSLVISPDHIQPESNEHRKKAIEKIDTELAALLQSSSLYELGVKWEGIITRYVYTRRGLLGATGFGVASTSKQLQEPVVMYSADDLLWDDGLSPVRELLTRPATNTSTIKPVFQVNTPPLLAWYNEWKGLPADTAVSKLPCVTVATLLTELGVPAEKMVHIQASLTQSDLPMLRSLVLRSFHASVDAGFVSQLVAFDYSRPVQAGQIKASYGDQPRLLPTAGMTAMTQAAEEFPVGSHVQIKGSGGSGQVVSSQWLEVVRDDFAGFEWLYTVRYEEGQKEGVFDALELQGS